MCSGGFRHVTGESSLPPEERKTVTNSSNPCLIMTAFGIIETDDEATVYIIDMFVCVVDRIFLSLVVSRTSEHI